MMKTLLGTAAALALAAPAGAQDSSTPPIEEWAVTLADGRDHDDVEINLAGAKKIDALFEAYLVGVRIGKLSLDGVIGPNGYDVATKMRTTGVVSLVANTKQWARSRGAVSNDGPAPIIHDFEDHKRGDIPHKLQLVYGETETDKVAMWSEPTRRLRQFVGPDDVVGAVDPLSGILQAGFAVGTDKKPPCSQTAKVFDGRRRYDLRLEYDSKVRISGASDGRYNGLAYKCRVFYDQIAGFKPKNIKEDTGEITAYMYFADFEDHGLRFPVKAIVNRGVASVAMFARDISIKDAPQARVAGENADAG